MGCCSSFTKPFKKAISKAKKVVKPAVNLAKKSLTAPTDLAKKAIGTAAGMALGGGGAAGGGETNTNTTTSVTPVTNITNKTDLEPLAKALQDGKDTTKSDPINIDLSGLGTGAGSGSQPVVVNMASNNKAIYAAAGAVVLAALIYKFRKGD